MEEAEVSMDDRGALTVRDAGRLGGRRLLEKLLRVLVEYLTL